MYVKPYIDYYIEFHQTRDYFECHEILEEYWKKDTTENRNSWVVLIQLAVGLYHYRRGNIAGAKKMLTSISNHTPTYKETFEQLGIDYNAFVQMTATLLNDLNNQLPYKSITIPLNDFHLMEYLQFKASLTGQQLYMTSDMRNTYLVNKHSNRDRTDVIKERNIALARRKKKSKSS